MKNLLILSLIIFGTYSTKAQTTIVAKDAIRYLDKTVTICDSVYSTKTSESVSLLNFGGRFPNAPLILVVYKKDRANFEKEPHLLYNNKKMCVTGKVTEYQGKLQLVLNSPKQIQVKNKNA